MLSQNFLKARCELKISQEALGALGLVLGDEGQTVQMAGEDGFLQGQGKSHRGKALTLAAGGAGDSVVHKML